jgi:small-conductance mechanosensitive channel
MTDYVWIFHAGVSRRWVVLVTTRRILAPDHPQLRITAFSDEAAAGIDRLAMRATLIGMTGWLLAGLAPTLGLGFTPAMPVVSLAGTAASGLILAAVIRHRHRTIAAVAELLPSEEGAPTLRRALASAAPAVAIASLAVAYLSWLASWLETGTDRMVGPVGTLVVLLLLPVFLSLGEQAMRSLVPSTSPQALRYRAVQTSATRTVCILVAIGVIAHLWGFSTLELAHGTDAPMFAGALFDLALIGLAARLVWQLIMAALHPERRMAGGEEEAPDSDEAARNTRLDTLIPLMRTFLLILFTAVAAMAALSELGVDIGPLLASAGIVGIAVGFSAQTLVRDIFSDAFFLIDDDSALVIRVKFKCRPRTQFVLCREIHHALRALFAENGIRLARLKVEVVTEGRDAETAAAALPDDVLAPGTAQHAG